MYLYLARSKLAECAGSWLPKTLDLIPISEAPIAGHSRLLQVIALAINKKSPKGFADFV